MTEYHDPVAASAFRHGVIEAAKYIDLHPMDFLNSLKLLVEIAEPSALAFASQEERAEEDSDSDMLEVLKKLGVEVIRVNFEDAPAEPAPCSYTNADENGWFVYHADFVPKDGWVTLKVDGYVPVNAIWDDEEGLWCDAGGELMGDRRAGKCWVPTHWRPIVM